MSRSLLFKIYYISLNNDQEKLVQEMSGLQGLSEIGVYAKVFFFSTVNLNLKKIMNYALCNLTYKHSLV